VKGKYEDTEDSNLLQNDDRDDDDDDDVLIIDTDEDLMKEMDQLLNDLKL
jgi:hypothetical protein